jgi:2',3'-cyclic-nucleotide 2'-phosphodiesterase/3'-nucleotidase
MTLLSGVSRRSVLAATAASVAAPLAFSEAAQAGGKHHPTNYRLTVLGTSDTHGNVYNWDYYKDAEYDDSAHNDVGVAKLAALVTKLRREATNPVLVLDAGDTIQGTPLATYYAKQEPITATGEKHPMARAMNVLQYDAITLGNHEFNYGLR